MRMELVPENAVERAALALGLVPTPLIQAMCAPVQTEATAVAVKLGIFQSLADGPLSAVEVAERCGTDDAATEKLLNALTGVGLLRFKRARYELSRIAKRWLHGGSRRPLCDMLVFSSVATQHLKHLEFFLRSGKPLDVHADGLDREGWSLYQKGMRSMAALSAKEVARKTFVPKAARKMLDIGGSHGLYSVELCRRHPKLHAVILDLPQAVEHAAPLLMREGMGQRVVHRPGDVLEEDLGVAVFDLIFVSQLVHHFDVETNRELVQRAARALRPGGALVVQEVIRPASPRDAGQLGSLLDMYFALTSESGTWSYEEIAEWQREAGLVPRKPLPLRTLPGGGQQAAVRLASA